MRKMAAVAAVVALVIIGGASMASAGEVTGTGELTPISGYQAGSICAFSGLDDGTGEHGTLCILDRALQRASLFLGESGRPERQRAHQHSYCASKHLPSSSGFNSVPRRKQGGDLGCRAIRKLCAKQG